MGCKQCHQYELVCSEKQNFDPNIDSWDVSNVEDMGYMFFDADGLVSTLASWDVSMVRNMDENVLSLL